MDWFKYVNVCMAWQWVSRAKADHIYVIIFPVAQLLACWFTPVQSCKGARAYDSDRRPDVRDKGHSVGDVKCESSVSLVRLWSLTCHCAHPFMLTRGCTTGSLLFDLPSSLSCLVSDKWNALVCPNCQSFYLSPSLPSRLSSTKSVFMSWSEVS